MSSFVIEYTERRLGRERRTTGHYVTFEYNPMRDTYRAIVRPSTALGRHAVELNDIHNLQEFANWLDARCRQSSKRPDRPRLCSEIPLPQGETLVCTLAGIGTRPYS